MANIDEQGRVLTPSGLTYRDVTAGGFVPRSAADPHASGAMYRPGAVTDPQASGGAYVSGTSADPKASGPSLAEMEAKKAPWLKPFADTLGNAIDVIIDGPKRKLADPGTSVVPAASGQKTFGVDYGETQPAGVAVNRTAPPVAGPYVASNAAYDGSGDIGSPALTTMNLSASNEGLARANAIRQSILDDPNLGGGGPRVTMLPNSQNVETQKLFDKWANEALVRDMMGRRGGEQYAASIYNTGQLAQNRLAEAQIHGQNQLGVVDAQGRNRLAETALQGQNQLNVVDLQGQNQLEVTGLQGRNQLENTRVSNQGSLDVQGSRNQSAEKIAGMEDSYRREAASGLAYEKHLDSIPKILETMSPKDPDYKELVGVYKSALLGRARASQQVAPPPMPKVGEVRGGHRYIGGNPADQSSWSAV